MHRQRERQPQRQHPLRAQRRLHRRPDRRHQHRRAVAFGKRQGTATINEFDDKSLEKVVRRAEDLARLAPENPEFMPAVAKQFRESSTFVKKTADIDPESAPRPPPTASKPAARRAWWPPASSPTAPRLKPSPIRTACSATRQTGARLHLHRAHRRRPRFGLGQALGTRCGPLRRARSGRRGDRKGAAFGRCQGAGAGPLHRDPGTGRHQRPAGFMFFERLRRAPRRRRPQLPVKKGGKNRLGDKLFDQQVNIWADPWDKDVPVLPWDAEPCWRANAWT
jgi:hypothetical protein